MKKKKKKKKEGACYKLGVEEDNEETKSSPTSLFLRPGELQGAVNGAGAL